MRPSRRNLLTGAAALAAAASLPDDADALVGGRRIAVLGGRRASPGYFGRTFDGSGNALLNIGPSPSSYLFNAATQVTIVARVRLAAGGSGIRSAVGIEIGSGLNGLVLGVSSAGVVRCAARSQVGDSLQSISGATTVGAGSWHTIAGLIDFANATIDVYLDGVLDTSGSHSVTFGAASYATSGASFSGQDRIGSNATAVAAEPFNGSVCDLAFFPRLLSGAELLAITAGGRPDAASGGQPTLYLPMDSATDLAGQFCYSRFGGQEAAPTGVVSSVSSGQPSLTALQSQPLETRFLPTRVFRLSAADAASVGAGNPISSVKLRNSGSFATQTGSNRPLYQVVSGRGAIQFTAASSQSLVANVGQVDTTRGFTVVAIAQLASGANNEFVSLSSSSTTDGTTNSSLVARMDVGVLAGAPTSAGFETYTDYTAGSSGDAIFSGRWSGNQVVNWLNGVKRNGTVTQGTKLSDNSFIPTNLPVPPTTQLLQIGQRLSSGSKFFVDGYIYDMVVVVGALTDEEVQYLEGVLAWDTNFTSLLPANHPWKTTQPTITSPIAYPWGNAVVARSAAPNTSFLGGGGLLSAFGKLYATHDFFNAADTGSTGRLYVSADSGANWRGLAAFSNFQWSTIWQHTDGNLYIFGLTRAWGDVQIGKSTNQGASWTFTTLSGGTGPIVAAGAAKTAPNYATSSAAKPAYYDGFMFLAVSNNTASGATAYGPTNSFVMYISASADLTNPANWHATSQLAIGSTGKSDSTSPAGPTQGMLEGNVVLDDANVLWDVLRFGGSSSPNFAVFIPLTWANPTLSMPAWSSAYIKALPGGNVKFNFVKANSKFYAVTNNNTANAVPVGSGFDQDQRDLSTIVSSPSADLSSPSFTVASTLINGANLGAGLSAIDIVKYAGFQYVAPELVGGTLGMLHRVGWSGPASYGNANFMGYGASALP